MTAYEEHLLVKIAKMFRLTVKIVCINTEIVRIKTYKLGDLMVR